MTYLKVDYDTWQSIAEHLPAPWEKQWVKLDLGFMHVRNCIIGRRKLADRWGWPERATREFASEFSPEPLHVANGTVDPSCVPVASQLRPTPDRSNLDNLDDLSQLRPTCVPLASQFDENAENPTPIPLLEQKDYYVIKKTPKWWTKMMETHDRAGGGGDLSFKSWTSIINQAAKKAGVSPTRIATAFDWICFSGQGLSAWMDRKEISNPTERLRILLRDKHLPSVVADSDGWTGGNTQSRASRIDSSDHPDLPHFLAGSAEHFRSSNSTIDEAERYCREQGIPPKLFDTVWDYYQDQLRLEAAQRSGYKVAKGDKNEV